MVSRHSKSKELAVRAKECLAGGVSSHFRFSGDRDPLFFQKADGAVLTDVDGNEYLDYALGMGPTILGHAPQVVTDAVRSTLVDGQLYAGMQEMELQLAELIQSHVPCAELLRFGLSGSEMSQAAIRTARAATGRELVVKFEGMYHGWFDPIFANKGADRSTTVAEPMSAGQPRIARDQLAVLNWNDVGEVESFFEASGPDIAAVIMEGAACNTGVIPPRTGYLERVRQLCDEHGAGLIFDEVITGFRLAVGGAQERFGVTPDLAVFAKAFGGGFPIAALAGSSRFMDPLANGTAVHAGTYNSSIPTVAAASATIRAVAENDGAMLKAAEGLGDSLIERIRQTATKAGADLHVQGFGVVFNTTFGVNGDRIETIDQYLASDLEKQARFLALLQERGVRPTSRGTWFVSTAHTEAEVEATVRAVEDALGALTA